MRHSRSQSENGIGRSVQVIRLLSVRCVSVAGGHFSSAAIGAGVTFGVTVSRCHGGTVSRWHGGTSRPFVSVSVTNNDLK